MRSLIILVFCIMTSIIALKGENGFIIEKYHVEVLLQEDGAIKVIEDIQVNLLEKRRGIYRDIPVKYNLGQDKNYRVKIEDIEVSNWNYKVTERNGMKNIRIGQADRYLTGLQNYKITYRVYGAISRYMESDEFYWNVIGVQWEVPIKNASYEVRFPYGWKSKVSNYKTFIGDEGSVLSSLDTLTENIIQNDRTISLSPNQGISIAFELPPGLLPDNLKSYVNTPQNPNQAYKEPNYWLGLIPTGLAALLFGQWRQKGKRQSKSAYINEETYPPVDMSPAQVGTFYDYKVNRRDIIALLPYWGEEGYLKMRQLEEDVYFEKIQHIPDDEPEYARYLFKKIFESSDSTLLSSFQEKMYQTMGSVANKIMKEVKAKELYDSKAMKTFHSGWMIALSMPLFTIGIMSIVRLQADFMGIGFIILAIYSFVIHFLQPRLSEKGRNYHEHLRGLYQFLKEPNPEKLNELMLDNPNYINQLFPYALAFGLDKEWEQLFKSRDYDAPDWYVYDSMFHQGSRPTFDTFAKDFGAHNIEKVFYSAPASSSTGGGGGSVGSGFGGGGGGTW